MKMATEINSFVYINEKETDFPLTGKPSGEGLQRSGRLEDISSHH